MSVNVNSDQAYAYSELLEVLSLMEEEYINRIPKKLMHIFEVNKSPTYVNHIDVDIPIEQQDLSEKTSALLAMLMLNYWCDSEEQKQELKNVFDENEKKYQAELKEKYNPNNIFKINDSQAPDKDVHLSTDSKQNVENSSTDSSFPVDYNSFPWYKKIIEKVRNIIHNLFKQKNN